jgi:hypothetical protein
MSTIFGSVSLLSLSILTSPDPNPHLSPQSEIFKLREELKICSQQLVDEQLVEWQISFAQHLKLFLDRTTPQLETLLSELHNTTELFQRTLEIFGEAVYPDNKTLEGEDMSALFLTTIAKVVSCLSNSKRDIEKNPLLYSDSKSSQGEDTTGSGSGGGRRRPSLLHSKSGRLSSSGPETPPPPPPPKRSVSENTLSVEHSPSPRGAMSPSPPLDSVAEGSHAFVPSPQVSLSSVLEPEPTAGPVDAIEAKIVPPAPKEKATTEKSTRPTRSKARIATL